MKSSGLRKILIIAIILTLIFIWGNSLFDKEDSAEISGIVKDIIEPFLELFTGKGNVTDHLVRKLAHFCEYALLGFELCWFFSFERRARFSIYLIALSHGMFTAMIDETIQIFAQRGSSLVDVWLDSSGAATGAIVIFLILICTENRKK